MGMFQTTGSNERFGILEVAHQRTVAAAGSSQATGTTIGANVTYVTGATGSNAVTLRAAKKTPYTALVYSSAATNALLIFPPSGGAINNGTTDASFSATARTPYIVVVNVDNSVVIK